MFSIGNLMKNNPVQNAEWAHVPFSSFSAINYLLFEHEWSRIPSETACGFPWKKVLLMWQTTQLTIMFSAITRYLLLLISFVVFFKYAHKNKRLPSSGAFVPIYCWYYFFLSLSMILIKFFVRKNFMVLSAVFSS